MDWTGWVPAVDVAEYQPGCDYGVMAQHVRAMWAKAGQGMRYIDPLYDDHRAGWTGTGSPFGAYYFPEPDRSSADDAAHRFLEITGNLDGCTLPAMLDMEDRPGTNMVAALGAQGVADWVVRWLEVVDASAPDHLGPSIVYVGGYYGMAADGRLRDRVNWTPNYGSKADYATEHGPDFDPTWYPKVHPAFAVLGIFQHSGGNGRCPGSPRPIDLDLIAPAVWAAMTQEDPDMPLTDADVTKVSDAAADKVVARLTDPNGDLYGKLAAVGWSGREYLVGIKGEAPVYELHRTDDPDHPHRLVHVTAPGTDGTDTAANQAWLELLIESGRNPDVQWYDEHDASQPSHALIVRSLRALPGYVA